MGNNVEQHLKNARSTSSLLYQLTALWGSPRGTVLRIQALALVAIALSFLLAAFGSCRRWSNRWIVQKGFLAAQVLSLSLGTYSIGLMQSSSVKSEMYPIWAVSLVTLFGCIDPITAYIGLDYKGPLSKMIFQICLYCGYVLLMSSSTMSSDVGKVAIGVMCAITFFKGFHKSLAFVQQRKTRDDIEWLVPTEPAALVGNSEGLRIHLRGYISERHNGNVDGLSTLDIHDHIRKLQLKEVTANEIEDVCLGYALSHLLQRRFLGLDTAREMENKREKFQSLVRAGRAIDYTRTLKSIEVELAFLYEVYFTSNEFLHLYQAGAANFWAIASFIGICFVGVLAAIPGTIASRHRMTTLTGPGGGSSRVVVGTTTADLIITLVILVSLAVLQLVQLIRCWTSNWARVAFASEYTRNQINNQTGSAVSGRWMRTKAFVVTRMNWFENKYLWQDKLGQHSVVAPWSWGEGLWNCLGSLPWMSGGRCLECRHSWGDLKCQSLLAKVGAHYILEVLDELLANDTSNPGGAVRLHHDVKTCVAEFLCQIKSGTTMGWSSWFFDNGLDLDASWLPYSTAPLQTWEGPNMSDASAFTHRVMAWHIATFYCELKEQQEGSGRGEGAREKNVAISLSRYCAYLAAYAPELLPGSSAETDRAFDRDARATKRAYGKAAWRTSLGLRGKRDKLKAMEDYYKGVSKKNESSPYDALFMGVDWGKRLLKTVKEKPLPELMRRSDPWEALARLWVQTLLYAAPYGDAQAHMQHLSQGGEFITHLWALLYHLGIDRWERELPTM